MKRTITAIMLSILMLSGCATTAQNSEAVISEESGSSASVEEKESSFSDIHPNIDIYFELDLEEGKFYEIPRLAEEEEAAFEQSVNCAESLIARLESYGVLWYGQLQLYARY